MDPVAHPVIKAEMQQAWLDSQPDDPTKRHEEGGYILLNADGSLSVIRWPRGERSRIVPPPMEHGNRYNGLQAVAGFHTHPNPAMDDLGRAWEQGPSGSDQRWHR